MRVLLDTHSLVWFLSGDPRCTPRARDVVEAAEIAFVSAASAWEIATKVRIGRWPEASGIADTLEATVVAQSFQPLAMTIGHSILAGSLEGQHRDPFDRMLAAQALIERTPIVSADPVFPAFGVETIW